jgi:hypothetical protein
VHRWKSGTESGDERCWVLAVPARSSWGDGAVPVVVHGGPAASAMGSDRTEGRTVGSRPKGESQVASDRRPVR